MSEEYNHEPGREATNPLAMAIKAGLINVTPRRSIYNTAWYTDKEGRHNEKQHALLMYMGEECLFGGAAGGGKGLTKNGIVMTQYGPQSFFDLEVGHRVYAPDGSLTKIMQVTDRGEQDVYDVEFSDGAKIRVDADHLWLVKMASKIQKTLAKRGVAGRVVPTWWLARWMEQQSENKRQYRPMVPLSQPLEFSRVIDNRWGHKRLVDPYLLGVVIGDGHITDYKIEISSVDEEIYQRIRLLGIDVQRKNHIHVLRDDNRTLRLLNDMGLKNASSWNKFIPEPYRLAPVADRINLLQGLFDTDGTIQKDGKASYCSTSKQLALDVQWLLRSIGFKATIYEKEASYRDKNGTKVSCRLAYNIHVSGQDTDCLFHLTRKKNRCTPQQKTGWRTITNITRAGREHTKCITVDHPSGLFVADDFIVTHNSAGGAIASLQYFDVNGYAALLLRRTWSELTMKGGLIPMMREWLAPFERKKQVSWSEANRNFKSNEGAVIQFGHMEHESDIYKYLGTEWQYIFFDQLENFTEEMYLYMHSRLRRPEGFPVPIRMRASANPGGISHEFIKSYFIENQTENRIFIPAKVDDNPFLDREAYKRSLSHLPLHLRRQLLNGDWNVRKSGDVFHREWFNVADESALDGNYVKMVRFWDMAGKLPTRNNTNPDFTAGVLMGKTHKGTIEILDLVHFRSTPPEVDRIIKQTAISDGPRVCVGIEQQPGAAGLGEKERLKRLLSGHWYTFSYPNTNKLLRARPLASAAQNGLVTIKAAGWNAKFLDELTLFGQPRMKDDIVDASSGAFNILVPMQERVMVRSALMLAR
jgi:predicted phage terminase large subunit-like protein